MVLLWSVLNQENCSDYDETLKAETVEPIRVEAGVPSRVLVLALRSDLRLVYAKLNI
jgi:hypothetical protein